MSGDASAQKDTYKVNDGYYATEKCTRKGSKIIINNEEMCMEIVEH